MAQFRPLDHLTYKSWPKILDPKINNDGLYIAYLYKIGDSCANLMLQSTQTDWQKEICKVNDYVLMGDANRIVCLAGSDTIKIIEPGKSNETLISNVGMSKFPEKGNGNWIAYAFNSDLNNVHVRNVKSGEVNSYAHVINCDFSRNGCSIFFEITNTSEKELSKSIVYLNLLNGETDTIWSGYEIGKCSFSDVGDMFSFLGSSDSIHLENTLFYFKRGMHKAMAIVNLEDKGMEGMCFSKREMAFSKDGNIIFFYIEKNDPQRKANARDSTANLIVWNSKDDILSSDVPNFIDKRSFATSINLTSPGRINRLETEEYEYVNQYFLQGYEKKYVIVRSRLKGNTGEYRWRSSARPDIYLVSVIDGSKVLLLKNAIDTYVDLSPASKYAVWYERSKKQWISYTIKGGLKRDISHLISCPLNADIDYSCLSVPVGSVNWLEGDSAVFIYDRHDIWMLDPEGRKTPVNVTQGYGRKKGIRFRFLNLEGENIERISLSKPAIISGFNEMTKDNGLMVLKFTPQMEMNRMSMYPKTIYFDYKYTPGLAPDGNYRPFRPLKAKYADTYLTKIMDAGNFPNLFVTSNFVDFQEVTRYAPQKEYNWYKNELIKWRSADGRLQQGILYKPQNFDSTKTYPTIYLIYEKYSDVLNAYINPHLSNGILNIPWYVSNGYMVLVPDITYKIGHPGESALNAVLSAMNYLSQFPFFDVKKVGIQGISYGGYEVNYIVSHTNVFAAAAPSAGVSNLMSEAGQFTNNSGKHEYYEERQGRIGASLWDKPYLYIENSPIFNANRVRTPMLILHNKLDDAVYTSQSVEWFTALRRLGKEAWMLQYVDESHTLLSERNKLDYSIKLSQFFDHFLKGKPIPKWMGANNSN